MASQLLEESAHGGQLEPLRGRSEMCRLRQAARAKHNAEAKQNRGKISRARKVSKPALFPSHQTCKQAGLIYVGTSLHARDVGTLQELGIGAVLNCAPAVVKDPIKKYRSKNIAYAEIDCADTSSFPILKHLPEASNFIHRNHMKGTNVLVHCMAGANRSATIALGHILLRDKPPFLQLFEETLGRRPCILSNVDFQLKLCTLAHSHGLLTYKCHMP